MEISGVSSITASAAQAPRPAAPPPPQAPTPEEAGESAVARAQEAGIGELINAVA